MPKETPKPDKTFSLYQDSIVVNFWEKLGRMKHVYRLDGKEDRLTSVTTITGSLDKPALIAWAVKLGAEYLLDILSDGGEIFESDVLEAKKQHLIRRDKAANSGTAVHDWAMGYARGEKPAMPEDEEVLNGVTAFFKWTRDHNVKFLKTEFCVYSTMNDYVGMVDALVEIDGKTHIVDYKTGSGVYPEAHLQVAGYINAYDHEFGVEHPGIILHFDKKGGEFTVHEVFEQGEAILAFQSLRRTQSFLKTYDDAEKAEKKAKKEAAKKEKKDAK